ncbi:MAG: hypothetical protein K5694_05110 [Bacilli bacterium]|nr:hypothetical protein [Bacilli bacterium]
MNKKNIFGIGVLSTIALLLGGCGNGASPEATSTSVQSQEATSSAQEQSSSEEKTSEEVKTSEESQQSISSESQESGDLEEERALAIKEITEAFNLLDITNYSRARWASLVTALNTATRTIKSASEITQILSAKAECLNAFASAKTMEECTAGTIFDYSSGAYEFDRDEEGHLLVQYYGRPGHWVYIGTKDLQMDISTQNVFNLTIRNNKDFSIKLSLKLADANGAYEEETGIVTLGANATKTLILNLNYAVTNVYFFVDSTEDHDRNGEIAIMDYHFSYEERTITVPEPKLISMNNVAIEKDGAEAVYELTENDEPYSISRVSYLLKVYYNGNGSGGRYLGVNMAAGGNTQYAVADSAALAQDNDTYEYLIYNMEVSSNKHLSAGAQISLGISYNAPGLTFEVESFTLYYSSWPTIVSETLAINKVIYESEYVYENNKDVQNTLSKEILTVPFSDFTKQGTPTKMEIAFTHVNPNTYSKSSIHLSGFPITYFASGTNDLFNTAPIMAKNTNPDKLPISQLEGVESSGTITLYPTSAVNLKSGGELNFDCWWSCATSIRVDSITMYTEAQ